MYLHRRINQNKTTNKDMKKKSVFYILSAAAAAVMSFTSCDKSSSKMDEKPATATADKAEASSKIAFVEVDSIMTQYTFCKEYSKILEQKGNNIQKTLATKQQQLQAAAANFQQKIQQNAYTREQAESVQAGLQKQNNDLQALNQRLSNEFQAETEQFNKALHDSIQNYLAIYNKNKKYGMIFAKQGDNVLYADKAYDITNEVVAGLNKAYKGKAKAADAKAKK